MDAASVIASLETTKVNLREMDGPQTGAYTYCTRCKQTPCSGCATCHTIGEKEVVDIPGNIPFSMLAHLELEEVL